MNTENTVEGDMIVAAREAVLRIYTQRHQDMLDKVLELSTRVLAQARGISTAIPKEQHNVIDK
jgi:hypothetical protein